MNARSLARALMPPALAKLLGRGARALFPPRDRLVYAPAGWDTALPRAEAPDSPGFVAAERAEWDRATATPLGEGPLLFTPPPGTSLPRKITEHNQWVTYAYVLALAARGRASLKVLDYGGHLGYHYHVAKAALPGVALDYHCKELAAIRAEGARVNPGITWHDDDACLDARYDLVVLSAVLQYVREWKDLVARAARASDGNVFMTGVSSVATHPSYVAIQRLRDAAMHYQVINRDELRRVAQSAGMAAVREFIVDEHPPIDGAPEQPAYAAWLFRKG